MQITFKQGDTVAIPEGCTAEIKDGIITFQLQEPEQEPKQEFKKGDVIVSEVHEILLVDKHSFDNHILRSFVHIEKDGMSFCKSPYPYWNEHHTWRLATEEEKQKLFDAMKAADLRWNAAEKRVEKVRWRAEKYESYYFVRTVFDISRATEVGCEEDNDNYNLGNYFRTREQALAAAEAIKETLRKFHEEND